jgi:hypothetical protein
MPVQDNTLPYKVRVAAKLKPLYVVTNEIPYKNFFIGTRQINMG